MNFELRDYQREAAIGVLGRLGQARSAWQVDESRCAFALSAVTGSGKTVIATAVIEALLHGSADLDVEARPNTTFLWVTDDPALNRQTRHKMLQASELLTPGQIREIDTGYMDSELLPGRVYLLNIQKLSRNSTLAKTGTDFRQHSFWEVIGNTITRGHTELVLVLDEAHKGMKRATDRPTIVRQIIDGRPGSSSAMPAVWGISATIDRFNQAMADTGDRIRLVNVAVDTAKVRASGLLKDEIGVANPDESGSFSTTLLREAVKDMVEFERRWAAYSEAESEPEVLPVLVVQVPDKADETKLGDLVGTIEAQWAESGSPPMGPHAVVHVFGEHEPIVVGGRRVRWVPPESIQGDTDVRVVLAKTAISTGWDCPRAEVLYSERPAKDATHIAQIIGRMVRAPLARRITTDDALNSVSCYLPLFDRGGLSAIKEELEGRGKDADTAVGPEVLTAPATYERNPHLDPEVFSVVNRLLSLPAPDKLANPIPRAKRLAMYLADDAGPKGALVPDAGAELTASVNAKLDGLAAEHKAQVAAQVADLEMASLVRTRIRHHADGTPHEVTEAVPVATAFTDLQRDVTRLVRSVREGVGSDYAKYRYGAALDAGEPNADYFEAQLQTAALIRVPGVIGEIEARCTSWVQKHLATYAAEIANTTGATRDRFRQVQEQTTDPEALFVELRSNDRAATADRDGKLLPTEAGHLFADAEGRYPVALNALESKVLAAELARPSFVAWYRNPSRPVPAAVRVAYQRDDGDWSSVQVDFVIVSRRDDGQLGVSLVDPHGTFLADGRAKLRALADYAGRFGGVAVEGEPDWAPLVRVDAIAEVDGTVRVLDLLDTAVRQAVLDFEGSDLAALYASPHARDFE